MIQYGGVLRTIGGSVIVERENQTVHVGHPNVLSLRFSLTYPQLLSLITRLTEAAKDAAKVSK